MKHVVYPTAQILVTIFAANMKVIEIMAVSTSVAGKDAVGLYARNIHM